MRTDRMVWVLKLAEDHLERLTNQLAVIDDELAEYGVDPDPGVEAYNADRIGALYAEKEAVYAELQRTHDDLGLPAERLLEDVRDLRKAFEESLERSTQVDEHGYRQSEGYTVAFSHPPRTGAADFGGHTPHCQSRLEHGDGECECGFAESSPEARAATSRAVERFRRMVSERCSEEGEKLLRKFLASQDAQEGLQSCPQAAGVYTEVDASDLFAAAIRPRGRAALEIVEIVVDRLDLGAYADCARWVGDAGEALEDGKAVLLLPPKDSAGEV